MHVISKRGLRIGLKGVSKEIEELALTWYKQASRFEWKSFLDVQKNFADADLVDGQLVFNFGGNRYRLIVDADFEGGVLYVKHFLTHKEYSRGKWKK